MTETSDKSKAKNANRPLTVNGVLSALDAAVASGNRDEALVRAGQLSALDPDNFGFAPMAVKSGRWKPRTRQPSCIVLIEPCEDGGAVGIELVAIFERKEDGSAGALVQRVIRKVGGGWTISLGKMRVNDANEAVRQRAKVERENIRLAEEAAAETEQQAKPVAA